VVVRYVPAGLLGHATAPVPSEGVLTPLRGTLAAGLTKDPASRA
jgi:hypothetical protein